MVSKFQLLILATALVASSPAALAATPSQDQTGWFVDGGRYVNGQTPSYSAYKQTLIEGRNSAVIGNTSTDRDSVVEATGN